MRNDIHVHVHVHVATHVPLSTAVCGHVHVGNLQSYNASFCLDSLPSSLRPTKMFLSFLNWLLNSLLVHVMVQLEEDLYPKI